MYLAVALLMSKETKAPYIAVAELFHCHLQ